MGRSRQRTQNRSGHPDLGHQLKCAIDVILNLMPKAIRGKLFTPNVHMDAIHIRSLFSRSDRALIGSQPSRRCATGRLSCADDRRFTCGLCSSAYGIRRCGLQDPWRRGVLEQFVSVGLASIMSVSMVVKSTSSKAAANSSSESLCA